MYAARKLYVKKWGHQSPDESYSVQLTRGGKPVPGIRADRVAEVEEEVMYWRKANHIHKWFVDNVQDGKDDRGEYYVSAEKLAELRNTCDEVIKASKLVDGMVYRGETWKPGMKEPEVLREPGKIIEDPSVAKRLLPTNPGFFFGSYEYDEDYLNDVVETRNWAADMLHDISAGVPGDVYYSSSW